MSTHTRAPQPLRTQVVAAVTLNVAPIEFDDHELEADVLPFESPDQLGALRKQHSSTHHFRRDAAQVLAIPLSLSAPRLSHSQTSIRLAGRLPIAAALVRDALINQLHSMNRPVLSFEPLAFVGARPENDLLRPLLSQSSRASGWLACRHVFEVRVRPFFFDDCAAFLGLSLDVVTRCFIDRSCAELVDDGLELAGLYVGRRIGHPDLRIAADFQTLGRVVRVDSELVSLTDTRDADSVPIAGLYLDASPAALERCLRHTEAARATDILATLRDKRAAARTGPARLALMKSVLRYLSNLTLEMAPGVPFRITSNFLTNADTRFPDLRTAHSPAFLFDPAGTRTNSWSDGGLEAHGPYDRAVFTPARPKICVLCQRRFKGQVELFVRKFLQGVSPEHAKRRAFEKGFLRKYHLENADTEFFLIDSADGQGYRRAAELALQRQTDHNFRWNLALVQIEERFHDLACEENPYLVTKAELLAHQVPSQEFEIETTSQPDSSLQYSLNNMGLAVYAKMGGRPWLMKANPVIAHELVIGLGSASIGTSRLGPRTRFVGITTVFSADGNYILSTISRAALFEEYSAALLEALRDSIAKARAAMNWQPRDEVRLVFHAFKPLKDAEVEAVKALLDEMKDLTVEYAFIHVVQEPGYLLFDDNQQGVRDFENRQLKGVLAPTRGWFFRLSTRDVLLVLTGAREVKRAQDGIPRPVLLRLHRDSTFTDTTYLANQVFAFSAHSWRSFFPARLPVTIEYSHLVARLLGQLQQLPRWNPNTLLGQVGRTRWFL